MSTRWHHLLAALSLLLAAQGAAAQADRLDEARRYLVRGSAAMEMAKSPEDLAAAAREFRTATQLAPGLATAWFNLGFVEAKLNQYGEAADAYRRYLQLSPKAEDAAKIGNEIIKLDYLQERSQAKSRVAGTWVLPAQGTAAADAYQVRFEDEKFVMAPSSRSWLGREVALYTDKGERDRENSFKAGGAQVVFVGRLVGDRIVGERIRPETVISFDEEEPLCRLREKRTSFEGRLADDGTTLTLTFSEPRYRVSWGYIGSFLALGTSKSCRMAEEVASEDLVLRLARQQPASAAADRPAGAGTSARSAREYLQRGAMALEVAKSDEDLVFAEMEFRKATQADPQAADAWYNLGLLYAKQKKYPDAAAAYEKYLAIRPTAENARQVEDEITRLKYYEERRPQPVQPGWTFLAKKTSGDRLGDTFYYDRSTIRTEHGMTTVIALYDYATPPPGGWDFNSVKQLHEINCAARKGRRLSVDSYEGRMGAGKLLYQYAKPDQDYYNADTPGSIGKLLIDAVCR